MTTVTRLAVAVPTIVVLGLECGLAVRDGFADSTVLAANLEMRTWDASGAQPGMETLRWVREDLIHALASVPDEPTTHELLGSLAAYELGEPSSKDVALDQYRAALRLRPSSPHTWLQMAEVRYRTGDTGASFERELRRAAELGPSEPEVQRVGTFLGLAVYDELTPQTRNAVDALLRAGMRRDALEMMQISSRRGRLDVSCRVARGIAPGIDVKSSQLCQGTGVTS